MPNASDDHTATRRAVLQSGASAVAGCAFGAVIAGVTGNDDTALLALLEEIDAIDGEDVPYRFPVTPRWYELVDQVRRTPAHTEAGRIEKARFVQRMLRPGPSGNDHAVHQIAWSLVNDILKAEG